MPYASLVCDMTSASEVAVSGLRRSTSVICLCLKAYFHLGSLNSQADTQSPNLIPDVNVEFGLINVHLFMTYYLQFCLKVGNFFCLETVVTAIIFSNSA